ncbi:MAG: DNA gyrase inhibitor YacG [Acidobacteria bacterium]|nr:MAG: DNA gyrase inhibitor YacG [Acidobacteriota bacterium]
MTAMARCPNCKKKVSRDNPYLPFCSKRCRLLDLGRWLGGEYHVAGEKVAQEQEETAEQERDGDEDRQE